MAYALLEAFARREAYKTEAARHAHLHMLTLTRECWDLGPPGPFVRRVGSGEEQTDLFPRSQSGTHGRSASVHSTEDGTRKTTEMADAQYNVQNIQTNVNLLHAHGFDKKFGIPLLHFERLGFQPFLNALGQISVDALR